MKPMLLIALLLGGLQLSHAFSEPVNLSRKVVNPDGSPAEGAKVIVIQRNTERSEGQIITTGVTDSDGLFAGKSEVPEHWERLTVLTLVLGGGSDVAFVAKSYSADRIPEVHPDIELTASTTLKTRVVGTNGKPIPNLRLKITQIADSTSGGLIPFSMPVPVLPDGLWSAVSDGEGRCEIDWVPPGLSFYLTHEDPSFSQPHGEMNIHVSWKTPMSDGDEYEVILTEPGSVSGRILLQDGSPAGNVEFNLAETSPYVTSFRSSAWTDDDGRFHLPSVPPSTYRPRIALIPPLEADWISAELEPVKIGDGMPTVLPDIVLVRAAEVTADIVDAVTGKKIAEPLIVRLPPGSHEIHYRSNRVIPDGYLEGKYQKSVDVKAGERKRITFELNPVTEEELVTGKVVDENGKPAADATVVLFNSGSWGMSSPVKTGADGTFSIVQNEDLKGGTAIATNRVDSVSERVSAEPGVGMVLVLKKGGFSKINGAVLDEGGKPIRKARVRLSHQTLSAGFWPEHVFGSIFQHPARSDDKGKFSFGSVWAGFEDYHFHASAEGFGDARLGKLTFTAGKAEAVSLKLKSASESLEGTVVDAGGNPVSGAWVNCSGEGQPGRISQVITDDEGRFIIEPLTKGTVYLNAGKYDAESSREVSARSQVPGGSMRLVLPVADGVVSGKVVDADGRPVAGAEVSASFRNRKAVSDGNGDFRITGLMSGWFEINASFEAEGQVKTVVKGRAKPGMKSIVLQLEPEKPEPKSRPEKQRNLIGQRAPNIQVETWFNSEPHPAKAGGKVRILDFWGLECAPCIATMPKIAKFWDAAPQDKLEIIALTGYYHDDEVREFLAKHPEYKFSFAKRPEDSTAWIDYDIRYNPTYVVIDRDGMIISYGSDWEKASSAALAEIERE